jgi:hypothetical protein
MERLVCADSCPFALLCGREVNRRNKKCIEQITTSLGHPDPSLVVKGDGLIEAYALTGEGNVQIGSVAKGNFKINELPGVLPPVTA